MGTDDISTFDQVCPMLKPLVIERRGASGLNGEVGDRAGVIGAAGRLQSNGWGAAHRFDKSGRAVEFSTRGEAPRADGVTRRQPYSVIAPSACEPRANA